MKLKRANLARAFAKYSSVFLVSVREALYFPQKLQTTLVLVPFRVIVLLFVYNYAFDYLGGTVNGVDAHIAIWSIAVYHILLFAQFRNLFRTINQEVRLGNFETQLNKPHNYLLYKIWEQFGRGVLSFLVSFIIVVPLLYLATGGMPQVFDTSRAIGAIALAIGGTMVSAALYIVTSLPVFWVDDADPFYWIVDKAILILGGAYIPLALLPSGFQTFATITPFGAPMFATQMFAGDFIERWPLLLTVQAFWLLVLAVVAAFMFNRAQQRLSVNGG